MQFDANVNSSLRDILTLRHFLVSTSEQDAVTEKTKFYNAYLLANFGIVVDKPYLLTNEMIQDISKILKLEVPKSFYANPQDTKYFTKEELLIEQIVSYFAYATDLGRIEIFKKDLPEYFVGDEIKLRTFTILNVEEAYQQLENILKSYCSYTRPFSIDELEEFTALYYAGLLTNEGLLKENFEIKCKDNIFTLLKSDIAFARFLDKKDIVKLSIQKFGDNACFKQCFNDSYRMSVIKPQLEEIASYIPYVKHCPMSKKQAKYYNKIVSVCRKAVPNCTIKVTNETNAQSPDRRALKFLAEGDVLGAAGIYASCGSMLERRIKMLLSRANPREAIEILDMLPAKNPIVLFQTINNIVSDTGESRTFTFYHDNKVKTHRETDYETTWRKSKLNDSTRKLLKDTCIDKIKAYYSSLPSLGNVYIADNFYKIGLPTNTSASGKGIDVLPTGSRVPCSGSAVRTFVRWTKAFDIDSSLIVVDQNNNLSTMGWFSYSSKPFGNDILFSGDITGRQGSEFYDINLDALAAKGYKYVIQTFHGYCDKLNSGEIYAGYQNKDNLQTKAWDAKNIETEFRVQGDSRGCIAFAIDIQSREVIILNLIVDDDGRIVNPQGFKTIEKYLNPDYLDITIGTVASCRGNIVENPIDADVVFDDTFVQPEPVDDEDIQNEYKIIRSWETEKLVSLINE